MEFIQMDENPTNHLRGDTRQPLKRKATEMEMHPSPRKSRKMTEKKRLPFKYRIIQNK